MCIIHPNSLPFIDSNDVLIKEVERLRKERDKLALLKERQKLRKDIARLDKDLHDLDRGDWRDRYGRFYS